MTDTYASPEVALDVYKRLFSEARDLSATTRESAKRHRRYYDGQIEDKLRRTLRRKKQPDFVINRVRPAIEGMIGVVERGKSEPRAYPRTPTDEDASEVATDSLRYVADVNRWHQNKLKVFRNILIEGTAAVIVEVDADLEVRIRRWRFEEFFYDPYSREPDFSDASYMGGAKWQYIDEIISSYPEYEKQLQAACQGANVIDANWNDRPDGQTANAVTWADPKRKRMLIVEMYKRERGTWMKCVFVGDLKLEEGVSPYQDNDGKPCNPIEAQSAYVDDENQRYGVVSDMAGPQDELNVYRRRAAHRATFRQVQESDAVSAYADPEEVRREAARPDGVLPPGYQVVPDDKFQLDVALIQEVKGELERLGPNPAILGRQGADSSGRSALIRQQAGLTELAHLFSGLEDLELRVYRQIWARIRQFWTQPKFLRVTDDEHAIRFIQINEPVWGPPAPVIDPTTGMPQYDPTTRQIVMRPQFMGMRNAVAQMGVDIIVDSTPDTANVQQEQYQALVELAKVGALGPNPGPFLLEASSLPKKRQVIERMKQLQSEQAQTPPSPEQQLAVQGAQAKIAKTNAETQRTQAEAAKIARETGMPTDPAHGQRTLLDLSAQQATIDKTFAQAAEARARAAQAAANAHATLYQGPSPSPDDGTGA